MIFAYRLSSARDTQGLLHGFHVFMCEDLVLPLAQLPQRSLDAFLAALKRQEIDSDATRIAAPGWEADHFVTRLNTAHETALRALPERHRPHCRLYTAALTPDRQALLTDLPAWINLYSENTRGEWQQLVPAANERARWRRIALDESDAYLHFALGQGAGVALPRAQALAAEGQYRLVDVLKAAQHPALAPCWTLRVEART